MKMTMPLSARILKGILLMICLIGGALMIGGCTKKHLDVIDQATKEETKVLVKESDSTSVKETPRAVPLPGSAVKASLTQGQMDSLVALFQAGKIERYYTTVDSKGLTTLTRKFDLMTRSLEEECRTRDSVIWVKDTEIYRLQQRLKESETVKENTKVMQHKPGFFEKAKTVINNWLWLIVLVVIGYLIGTLFIRRII